VRHFAFVLSLATPCGSLIAPSEATYSGQLRLKRRMSFKADVRESVAKTSTRRI
jgi:hypothetical protein